MTGWLASRGGVTSTLGVVQIFAWGSTYYLLAILVAPIIADTGWSRGLVTAGISLALFCSGLVALRVGRLIERQGGRPVLAGGVALIAAGLALLATAQSPALYLLAWAVIGMGMGGSLYDAAFSTLGRLYGAEGRRAITALTLWGGFASTVCWPISAWAVDAVGWRGTCAGYAAFHLLICLPLCLTLPREPALPAPDPATLKPPPPVRDARFWLLALAGTVLTAGSTIISVHLISLLTAQGIALVQAVFLGTLIGPAQVGARVIDMLTARRLHPLWTMAAATGLVGGGYWFLASGLWASAALVVYGAGCGLWSIARGALPLALFGPEGYPAIMGGLATPAQFAAAAAPSLGALLLTQIGPEGLLQVLAIAAVLPVLCALALFRLHLRA